MSKWWNKHGGENLTKAKIWKDDTGYVFGSYLHRLDGNEVWHYQAPNGNWAEALTLDSLMEYLKERKWL